MNFTAQFKAARSVSTPLICVRTPDPASTLRSLSVASAELAKDTKEPEPAVLTHDVMHGIRGFNDAGKQALGKLLGNIQADTTKAPPNFLRAIENVKAVPEADRGIVVFMANAHRFWNDPQVVQGIWNLRDEFKQHGATLVMLATFGATLPAELTQDVMIIDEPLPTEDEIKHIIKDTYKAARDYMPKLKDPDSETMTKAVAALIGIASFPSEQTTAMCLKDKGLDLAELWERKRQIVEQTPGLSIWRGGETFDDIGGCSNIKSFLSAILNGDHKPHAICFVDEIEKAIAGAGTDTSGTKTELLGILLSWMQDKRADGLIFIGPPGAAKSVVSKAAGNTGQIPTIRFDLAAMQGSLVGQSGQNMRAALATVDAVAKDRSLWLVTCNSLTALPPELRRRFRLGTFFFPLPDAAERDVIWKIYEKKYSLSGLEAVRPDDNGWTGAEIENCCIIASRLSITLQQAARYIVPVSTSAGDQIQALCKEASGKFISASHEGIYRHAETDLTARPIRKMRTTIHTGGDTL